MNWSSTAWKYIVYSVVKLRFADFRDSLNHVHIVELEKFQALMNWLSSAWMYIDIDVLRNSCESHFAEFPSFGKNLISENCRTFSSSVEF